MANPNYIKEFNDHYATYGITLPIREAAIGGTIVSNIGGNSNIADEAVSNGFNAVPQEVLVWAEKCARKIKKATDLQEGQYAMPLIRAITAGMTRNYNIYTDSCLRGTKQKDMHGTFDGLPSWTSPFNKPILQDHITGGSSLFGGNTATPFGRINAAMFSEADLSSYIIPVITDLEVVKAINDGRFITGSVGSIAGGVKCNICGEEIGWECPDHELGKEYKSDVSGKKETAGREFANIWHIEYSLVNVPAHSHSGIVNTNVGATSTESVMESLNGSITNIDMELFNSILKAKELHDLIHTQYIKDPREFHVTSHKKCVAKLEKLEQLFQESTGQHIKLHNKSTDNIYDVLDRKSI